MTCTCPKCKGQVELDVTTIPAEGSFDKCSACNANLLIRKESFARRALYKSTEISCAECGNSPGTSICCESCHAIYPDILVIETASAAKKQLGKLLASFNLFKKAKPHKTSEVGDVYDSSRAPSGKGKGVKLPGQPFQLAVIGAVLIASVAAGGYFWYQNKMDTQYSQQYVRALLVLKSSRDLEIKISSRVVTSWSTGASATLTGDELKSVNAAKKDVDALVKNIGKVPAKFTVSNDDLNKLYTNYGKLHEAVVATSGTSDLYAGAVKKMDEDFMKSGKELKAKLPEKISATLSVSAKKYKAFQEF